jgi:hypothetical protein
LPPEYLGGAPGFGAVQVPATWVAAVPRGESGLWVCWPWSATAPSAAQVRRMAVMDGFTVVPFSLVEN